MTIREVILRGLVASCITACTLRKWWYDRQDILETYGDWPTDMFESLLNEMVVSGVVEIQRYVKCPVCGRSREPGYSLTDKGYEEERKKYS